jgi:hypothetical protein
VAANAVAFGNVESTLYKRKRKTVPEVPPSIERFGQLMEEDQIFERYGKVVEGGARVPFFRGTLEGRDGSRTAVFATPAMCQALNAANEIHADATFKVVPRTADLYQLFSIHVAIGDHVSVPISRELNFVHYNVELNPFWNLIDQF